MWVDLPLTPSEGRAWRDRAAAHGVGVDAWLGVMAEFEMTLTGMRLRQPAVEALAAVQLSQLRLPPTDGLRRWVRLLDGRWDGPAPRDELPTVVLPGRLLHALSGATLLSTLRRAVSATDEGLAVRCERVAAAQGMTLEAWLRRTANAVD